MAKKTIFGKNQKVSQKVTLAILGQILASHNSTTDWARELSKPCKNS